MDTTAAKTYSMTIAGEAVYADEAATIRNPANTQEIVGLAPKGTVSDLNRSVDSAKSAFLHWRHSSDEERSGVCSAIARALEKHKNELALLLTKEQGKTIEGYGSQFELQACIDWCEYTAGQSLAVKELESNEKNHVELHRIPLGVVASITPWNWPLMIAIWHIIPAIRMGNSVVIKPSPLAPLSTLRMIQVISEVTPPGLVNAISGGNELGAALSQHPLIDKIVFTGSIETGRKVAVCAAQKVIPVTLELGGNDPGILLPGTDPSQFTESIFWGAMINSGQTCAALKRLYVHEDDYETVCSTLIEYSRQVPMGDGSDAGNILGPLQNSMQLKKVRELVEDARRAGARILCGGECLNENSYFYPITFVGDITDGTRLVDEEQFGPVLPIIRYKTLDDAIARANDLSFGLAASVWGHNKLQLKQVASKLNAGTVYINQHGQVAPHIPFGGIKSSGLGVEFGTEGLEAYTSIKVINSAL